MMNRWLNRFERRKSRLPGTASQAAATELDLAMMRRAIALARDAAARGEVPVGAVVYRNVGDILAEAMNSRELRADPTGHAEMSAIREAAERIGDWRLNEYSLAVTLEPCPMCAGAIVNARIGRLIYGAADPKAGAVASLYEICTDSRLNHRPEVIGGVLADECAALLSDFFRARRGSPGELADASERAENASS